MIIVTTGQGHTDQGQGQWRLLQGEGECHQFNIMFQTCCLVIGRFPNRQTHVHDRLHVSGLSFIELLMYLCLIRLLYECFNTAILVTLYDLKHARTNCKISDLSRQLTKVVTTTVTWYKWAMSCEAILYLEYVLGNTCVHCSLDIVSLKINCLAVVSPV